MDGFLAILQSYGIIGLIVLAFSESSFFPIPPDLLLIPMAFANKQLALIYGLTATIASVSGGVFGHLIGNKFGKPLLIRFFKEDKINKVQKYFNQYGGWAIAIAGFTPIPYKVFTISAGAFNVKLTTFIIASLVGRGGRFLIEVLLIIWLGDHARYYLENYFELTLVGITILFIAVYYIWNKYTQQKI